MRIFKYLRIILNIQKEIEKINLESLKFQKKMYEILNDLHYEFSELQSNLSNISYGLIEIPINLKSRLINVKQLLKPKPFPTSVLNLYGNSADGGYYLPKVIEDFSNNLFISIGVGDEYSFEKSLSNKGFFYFIDKNVSKDISQNIENCVVIQKNVGSVNDLVSITFDEIVRNIDRSKFAHTVLKLDSEGYEYDFFNMNFDNSKNLFDIIIVEFHNLHDLQNSSFYYNVVSILEKLNQEFNVIFFNGNNFSPLVICDMELMPSTVEVLYVSRNIYSNLIKDFREDSLNINSQFKINSPNKMPLPNVYL